MTDPIGALRRRALEPDPTPFAAVPPRPRVAPTHDAYVDAAVTAAVRAAADGAKDAEAQKRIDAVRDAFSGPYTVDGERLVAPPMFRMNGGYNQAAANAHAAQLDRIAKTSTQAQSSGYGGPKGLVKATQALIDAGKLPPGPPETAALRIKQMQWDWGIGVDCASYTRAAFEAVTGESGAAYGLKDPGREDFTGLASNKARFDTVEAKDARPGDIITLKSMVGEVGHNVIVYANTLVAPGVHRLEVDSSWGAGTGSLVGGYRRDTWMFDETTKEWTSTNQHVSPPETLLSSKGPADEKLSGVFRAR